MTAAMLDITLAVVVVGTIMIALAVDIVAGISWLRNINDDR